MTSSMDARAAEPVVAPPGVAPEELPKDSWVQCDTCNKWRRIPVALAEALGDDDKWHCKENPNRDFASCEVPQELTNEEIDHGAGGSDQVRVRIPVGQVASKLHVGGCMW